MQQQRMNPQLLFMTDYITTRRLRGQLSAIRKNPIPNAMVFPETQNIFSWHFCLYGLQPPYQSGIYHGLIQFPNDYPIRPPNLIFLTPNGRFKTNLKICLSFTSHHPEQWASSWTIQKMLLALISFMYEKTHTYGGIQTSDAEKEKIALQSRNYNLQSQQFKTIFGPCFERMGLDSIQQDEEVITDSVRQPLQERRQGEGNRWILLLVVGIFGVYTLLTCFGII